MAAARYVGRVGGLAVALGIGTAILTGQWVASADVGSVAHPGQTTADVKSDGATAKPRATKTVRRNPTTPAAVRGEPALDRGSRKITGAVTADVKSVSAVPQQVSDSPTTPSASKPLAATAAATTSRVGYQPTIGVADGVITGSNSNAQSSRGVPLTYTVIQDPSGGGKVAMNADTGGFTYLPYASGQNADGRQRFADSEKFSVLVAENTAFDKALEKLPLVGGLVKPVLVVIHRTPVLKDLLAPLIGYSVVVPLTVYDKSLAAGYQKPIAFTTTVVSFDKTKISVNYFPAKGLAYGDDAPTILNGPSLATAGYTNLSQESTVFGLVPGVSQLRAAGYNVVTWDPRGEFASGGVLQLDSPYFEAKDVSAIINWVSRQPGTQFDYNTALQPGSVSSPLTPGVNNPRIGMVGGSYGGGIQLTSAGIDPRIDAIAPGIAWNSLETALYPNDAFKTTWASLLLLSLVVSGARINPTIYSGIATGVLLGFLTQRQQDFLKENSPYNVVGDITAPTLFLQGTVDGLFPLQQAVDNAKAIEANGTEAKMIWYCGGHGQCLDPVNLAQQTDFLTGQTIAWMNTYVKNQGQDPAEADEIPNFQWVDQDGVLWKSNDLPLAGSHLYNGSAPIVVPATKGGTLVIAPILGGSGPQDLANFPVSLATAAKAQNAINITVPYTNSDQDPETPTYIVGQPKVSITYSGIGTSRTVYAQLVDDNTGRVVGNILTPIPVTLDGKTRNYTVPMEDIAYTMNPGDSLTLQIVGSATPYEDFTSYGVINISHISLTLPTANPANVTREDTFTDESAVSSGSGGLLGI